MWILLLVIIVSLFVIATVYKNLRNKAMNLPPSPISLPIIGHAHLWTNPKDMIKTAMAFSKTLGGIYSMQFGSQTTIFICDPKLIKEACITHRAIMSDRPRKELKGLRINYAKDPKGGMIISDHNEYHTTYRKLFSNHFTSGEGMKNIKPIIAFEIKDTLERLTNIASENKVITGKEVSYALTFNVITKLFLNKRGWNHPNKDVADVFHITAEVVDFVLVPFLEDLYAPLAIFDKQRVKEITELIKKRDALYIRILEGERKTFKQGVTRHWLDIIFSEHPEKTIDVLVPLMSEIIAGGFDTTAHALQTSVTILAKHPDIQEKLRDAVKDVNVDETPLKDLQNIPYLRNFVFEVFRIKPILPLLVVHKAREQVELGGYTIPKNAIIQLVHQYECKSEKLWKNPEEFDPSRWDDPPLNIYPFGQGVRRCPGERIGKIILFKAVASFVQRFSWKETEVPNSMDVEFASISKFVKEPRFYAQVL